MENFSWVIQLYLTQLTLTGEQKCYEKRLLLLYKSSFMVPIVDMALNLEKKSPNDCVLSISY